MNRVTVVILRRVIGLSAHGEALKTVALRFGEAEIVLDALATDCRSKKVTFSGRLIIGRELIDNEAYQNMS